MSFLDTLDFSTAGNTDILEEALKKVPSRFKLVLIAAHRAKQLTQASSPLISEKEKPIITSLKEIAQGKVNTEELINSMKTFSAFSKQHKKNAALAYSSLQQSLPPADEQKDDTEEALEILS